jgi:hypothetical protein
MGHTPMWLLSQADEDPLRLEDPIGVTKSTRTPVPVRLSPLAPPPLSLSWTARREEEPMGSAPLSGLVTSIGRRYYPPAPTHFLGDAVDIHPLARAKDRRLGGNLPRQAQRY